MPLKDLHQQGGDTMAIITISRQKGSLGDEIARAVSESLQHALVDKTKISDAMADLGLPTPEFERFDGKKPTIWQSMTDQKKRFAFLIRAVLYDFARRGNAVILGRGGQVLLKETPGTLHVRIVAPLETRVRRLGGLKQSDDQQAQQSLAQSDRDSSGFIRSFFDVDWEDESLYDVILNTRSISVGTAASLIVEATRAPEIGQRAADVDASLLDKALMQKARAVLVGCPGIDLTRIEVARGVIVLSGLARSKDNIESACTAVRQIDGVKEAHSKLEIAPLTGV
jgi:cytidylate kinase